MTFKIIIIGAGLSGSLLANGLLNNGVDFAIYERDAEGSKRDGYQIRLGDSAMTGFETCLTKSRINAITSKFGQSTGASSTAPLVISSKFKIILDLTQLPSYAKSYAINRVVLRNLLVEPVKNAGRVYFQKAFSYFRVISTPDGKEKIRVFFTDGTEDVCDILIGADGSGSKINEQVGARNLVPLNDYVSFLTKGDLPISRIRQLPPQLLKGPLITFTKQANFFFALYLPAKKSALKDDMAGDEKLDYDTDAASYYWGLNTWKHFTDSKSLDTTADRRKLCLDITKDWAPEYRQMMGLDADEEDSTSIYMAPLRASKKLEKSWRKKASSGSTPESGHPRVWLLGDAIHAMQPNRGQGGNQAMHDCAEILPVILRLHETSKGSSVPSSSQISEACAQYESMMFDRGFKWVMKSGGTHVLWLDFDGILGTVVSFISSILILVFSVLKWAIPGGKAKI